MNTPHIPSVVDFSSIRSAFPYIKAFRGKRFVFKLGGELCESTSVLTQIMEQIAVEVDTRPNWVRSLAIEARSFRVDG